jgi:putative hydrolase of the HAD superfamily
MGNSAPLAAVVFDAVGTLIEPWPTVAEAYAHAAARQGVFLDHTMLRDRFRNAFALDETDEQRGPLSTGELIENRRWRRIVGAVLPEATDSERAFQELWSHFADPTSWRVFEDVAPAMNSLREMGVDVRIGSNFDARLRRVLVGFEPLAPLADSAIVSSEVGYRKPHEAFYRAACESLRLPPNRVLFVGDDPVNDLYGPRQAGLHALALDRRGRDPKAARNLLGVVDAIQDWAVHFNTHHH